MSCPDSVIGVNRPRAYDRCACGSIKTKQSTACWTCHRDARAATRHTRDEARRRQFIHRVNYAMRERYGRTDLIPMDAPLPVGPCHYCGDRSPGGWDHVVPLASGGPNTVSNLVPCCLRCNHRKGGRPTDLLKEPEWIALRCDWCSTMFERRSADHRKHLRRGGTMVFCSVSCRSVGWRRLA